MFVVNGPRTATLQHAWILEYFLPVLITSPAKSTTSLWTFLLRHSFRFWAYCWRKKVWSIILAQAYVLLNWGSKQQVSPHTQKVGRSCWEQVRYMYNMYIPLCIYIPTHTLIIIDIFFLMNNLFQWSIRDKRAGIGFRFRNWRLSK